MTSKLACAVTALAAAALIGGDVFASLAAFEWAILSRFDLIDDPVLFSVLGAAPVALAAGVWMARAAYRSERRLADVRTADGSV